MDLTKIPVEYILRAAKVVKRIAYLIAAIGAAASYGTQVDLLKKYEMPSPFAEIIPATIDLLAICAAIALAIPGFPEKDRKFVMRVLIIAVLVSSTANFMGGHNAVTRVGHMWPVVAYLLAEGIANRIRSFVAQVQMAQAALDVPAIQESAAPVHVQASVGKSAATPTTKPVTAKQRILELAAATPPPSLDEIAEKVGTQKGWVKHVIKTSGN